MAYTRLAMTCHELKRTEEFESALGLAMEIDPEQPEILHFLGKLNLDQERYHDAGRLFSKLVEIEPDNVQNLLALGYCLFNGKEEICHNTGMCLEYYRDVPLILPMGTLPVRFPAHIR